MSESRFSWCMSIADDGNLFTRIFGAEGTPEEGMVFDHLSAPFLGEIIIPMPIFRVFPKHWWDRHLKAISGRFMEEIATLIENASMLDPDE